MTKEKEKGKSHPFAGHLRPTEEVLWLSAESRPTLRERFKVFLAVYILCVIMVVGIRFSNQFDGDIVNPTLTLLVLMAMAVPVFFTVMLWYMWQDIRPPVRTYAVTNERLLFRSEMNLMAVPLEDVPSISLFVGGKGRGTLSFGALFPMWSDMQDAAQLKTTIEQAQKRRVRDL